MTLDQYYRAQGNVNYASCTQEAGILGPYYVCTVVLPNGTSWTGKGSEDYTNDMMQAFMNTPVSAFLNTSSAPITGQIDSSNDLPVTLEVSGPNGTQAIAGKIDSGSEQSEFPTSFLQSLGYSPVSSEDVEGVTGSASEGVYDLPAIMIKGNSGQWETLTNTQTSVWGTSFGDALLGSDILKHCTLQVDGSSFVLGLN